MINRRLLTCAELVTGTGTAVDVGTDHAYLPIYLIESGKCKSVIACDIADGPLSGAEKRVDNAGLHDKIRLIKSDGLDSVPDDGVSDVIAAGMGGELIADIIDRAAWLKRGVNLVLQPNSKAGLLHRYLYENGFKIKCEKAVRDRRFIYVVMSAEYTGSPCNADDVRCNVGGLDLSCGTSRQYIASLADKLLSAAAGMEASSDADLKSEAIRLRRTAARLSELIDKAGG